MPMPGSPANLWDAWVNQPSGSGAGVTWTDSVASKTASVAHGTGITYGTGFVDFTSGDDLTGAAITAIAQPWTVCACLRNIAHTNNSAMVSWTNGRFYKNASITDVTVTDNTNFPDFTTCPISANVYYTIFLTCAASVVTCYIGGTVGSAPVSQGTGTLTGSLGTIGFHNDGAGTPASEHDTYRVLGLYGSVLSAGNIQIANDYMLQGPTGGSRFHHRRSRMWLGN